MTSPRWRRIRYAAWTVAGLVPSAAASPRTVGSAWPVSSAPTRIAASALEAISLAVEPAIGAAAAFLWYCSIARMDSYYNKTRRVTVRRLAGRGKYDRATVDAILDAGRFAHVGIVSDGQPFVIPMLYVRNGDEVYVHGSPLSRLLKTLADGVPMCLTVTLLDGLVLARSAFHSSMNYRSVMILGDGREIRDREEKLEALRMIVDHVAPGRSNDARGSERQGAQGDRGDRPLDRRGVRQDSDRTAGRRRSGLRTPGVGWRGAAEPRRGRAGA